MNMAHLLQTVVLMVIAARQSHPQFLGCNGFLCFNGEQCLPISTKCNYYDDCGDNSDETDCLLPRADNSIALIYTVTNPLLSTAYAIKLFGDPNNYARTLTSNLTTSSALPIHISQVHSSTTSNILYPIAVDYSTQMLYYGSTFSGLIYGSSYIYLNNSNSYYFNAPPTTKQIKGLAVDWLAGNVYWVDGDYALIGVVPVGIRSSAAWKAIVNTNLSSPQAVAVDPIRSYLFWTDNGNSSNGAAAKIERSDLSGSNRTVLLTSSTNQLILPTVIVIDFNTLRLYWLDSIAGRVGSCNMDGSVINIWTQSAFTTMSTMALYKDFVYFGSRSQSTFYIYDRNTSTQISSFTQTATSGSVVAMTFFSRDSQPSGTSPCQYNNGYCDQFCWTTSSSTRRCDCAEGFILSSDGTTCLTNPFDSTVSYLLIADYRQLNVYQLRPDTGEIRSLLTNSLYSVNGLAIDPNRRIIYVASREWLTYGTTTYKYFIRKLSLDGKINTVIYTASSYYAVLVSLSLDLSRQLLYFTDFYNGIVAEITTDGSGYRTFINDPVQSPVAVVINPSNRFLYWSDVNKPSSIQTMDLSSSTVRITRLITLPSNSSQRITGLAIDFDNQVIYWTTITGSTVQQSNIDGTGQKILYSDINGNYRGLTLFNNSLFIADSSRRNIRKFDLVTNSMSEISPGLFANASAITTCNASLATSPSTSIGTTSTPTAEFSNGQSYTTARPTSTESTMAFSSSTSSMPTSLITNTTDTASGVNDSIAIIAGSVGGGVGGLLIIILILAAVIVWLKLKIKSNANESTTVTPHVTGTNPAFVDEEVYDEIIEVSDKPVVVDASNTHHVTNHYEALVLAVRGRRPVSMFPSDTDASVIDNYIAHGYDNHTGVEQYGNIIPPSAETAGLGDFISDRNNDFGDYINPI